MTCVQYQTDDAVVAVGHAVMQRRVAVVISQVDQEGQEGRRGLLHVAQVRGHPAGLWGLLGRRAEPVLKQHNQGLPLETQRGIWEQCIYIYITLIWDVCGRISAAYHVFIGVIYVIHVIFEQMTGSQKIQIHCLSGGINMWMWAWGKRKEKDISIM